MNEEQKILSLSAIGLDSPGLVSKITKEIFELDGNIIDVEENCRRGLFSIFLIIDFSSSKHSMHVIQNTLKAIENKTGLKINLAVDGPEEFAQLSKKENHIITVLGVDQPGIIKNIATLFLKYNINIENCRMIARGKFFSMEMVIDSITATVESAMSHKEVIEKMKGELKDLCTKMDQSVVIQSEDTYKKMKKLVVFDVESTLIQDSSLVNFLEKIRGKVKSVDSEIQSKNNAKDQMQALVENARTLKGMPISDLERFSEILQLNPGAFELIRILKSMGFKIALLSSGFKFFLKRIFEEAKVDYAFSNVLEVDKNNIITGELEEPIITSDSKDELLEFIMNAEDISRDQVIGVGDGSTRSHFIKSAGLSIAFKPDEKNIETDGVINSDQITNVLYCLGITKTELDKHLQHLR
jgi:phosphoserine phosphatase